MQELEAFMPPMGIAMTGGELALDGIQNSSLPTLDLLVREAVQNSSDASLGVNDCDYFKIAFNVESFDPQPLIKLLGAFGKEISKKLKITGEASYIEVRDLKTTGLTGPISYKDLADDEQPGNFLKLVYGMGDRQVAEGAGGSRGLGKSMYFQFGEGLVLFYSRVKETNGKYSSRLIFAFAENQTSKTAILKKLTKNSIGRAWWGIRYSSDPSDIGPVTDEAQIETILSIFGVKPFKGDNTGTSVVIPFIDEDALLKNAQKSHPVSEQSDYPCPWLDTLQAYLEYSLQRWYFPRLNNDGLISDGKYKQVVVDGYINDANLWPDPDTMYPEFCVLQEAYSVTLGKLTGIKTETAYLQDSDYEIIKIENGDALVKKKLSKVTTGYLCILRLTDDRCKELGFSSAGLEAFLGVTKPEEERTPVVIYTREPGMIINYEHENAWTKGTAAQDGLTVVGLFVPDWELSINEKVWESIKPSKSETKVSTLGGYLRFGEKADHAAWNDQSGCNLVKNMTRRVAEALSASTKPVLEEAGGRTGRLSYTIGDLLLPQQSGYGKSHVGRSRSTGGGSSASGQRCKLDIDVAGIHYTESGMEIGFSLTMPPHANANLQCDVTVEGGRSLQYTDWEKTAPISTYPFSISRIRIDGWKRGSSKMQRLDITIGPRNSELDRETIFIRHGKLVTSFKSFDLPVEVIGTLILTTSDKSYGCTVSLR